MEGLILNPPVVILEQCMECEVKQYIFILILHGKVHLLGQVKRTANIL